MEISSRKQDNAVIVTVAGRMDTVTSPEFDKEFGNLMEQGEKLIILDFSGLDYISSAGLRSILMASKNIKEGGGNILLASLKDIVKQVFEVSGFNALLPIHDTLEEALSNI